MAHELDMTTGKAAIAFVGDRKEIWHGFGSELTDGATLATWKKEAGMNWSIKESQVGYTAGDEELIYPASKALYRSDTKDPLSIVGEDYKIVQPEEVLEFFKDLVGAGGMSLSTAGCLHGGRTFWALADTSKALVLNKKDLVKGYLLLTTSCDGTRATNAMFTSVRVVCNNTLRVALDAGAKSGVRVTHARTFDPKDVKSQLGVIDESWKKFSETLKNLAKVKMTDKQVEDFIYNLVAKPNLNAEDQPYTTGQAVQNVLTRYNTGMGADLGGLGTAWGALNAITEYADWEMGRIRVSDHKLWGSWYGREAALKERAFSQLQELAAA